MLTHGLRMPMSRLFLRLSFVALIVMAGVGSGRKPSDATPVPVKLSPWLDLRQFAKNHGFSSVKILKDEVELKGKVHTLRLRKRSRKAEMDGTLVWLNQPMSIRKKRWHLARVDVEKTLLPLIQPGKALKGNGYKIVVLDAGHGGDDSGAVSAKGKKEKDVALDLVKRVRTLLLKSGYKVYLTRHDDTFIDLKERPRRAKTWKADLFVSIHANSGPTSANGIETFALSIPGYASTNSTNKLTASKKVEPGNVADPGNIALSYAIQHEMRKGFGATDRGVKRARFLVLREVTCPGALVEVGFLSNPEEAKKLNTPAHREKVAKSIALGIENYLRGVRKAAVEKGDEKKKTKQDAE